MDVQMRTSKRIEEVKDFLRTLGSIKICFFQVAGKFQKKTLGVAK